MVTFLLTDVEGSTRLWEEQPVEMAAALAAHDDALTAVMRSHGGELIKSKGEGDPTFSVFDDAAAAVAAALDSQRAVAGGLFRIRIGIHTGDVEHRDGDYFGPTVNRCARLKGAAHGGQVVMSLATKQRAADLLPEGATLLDLGTHRLKDLSEPEQVFQLCHPDLAADFPPLASLDQRRHNLPTALTPLIGRADDVRAVLGALAEARLVTLLGPGGVGKTRLAIEVGTRHITDESGAVWFVDLSSATEDEQVLVEVARAIGVREQPGRLLDDAVADHVATTSTLVVLDNCEHLLGAATVATALLLGAGPNVRVLATSREALGVAGEVIHAVGPLSVPETASFDDSDAVALFLDRARRTDPQLDADDLDRAAVSRICRALDGLPLALELAAARLDALSVGQIADRLADRFELLSTASRTAQPRQRTLAAAIDWSYELLSGSEQEAFASVAVFVADVGLDGVEAVLGRGGLERLRALVAKSLLRRDGERYSMLESIRAYAVERLAGSGRAGAVHDRLVEWALTVTAGSDIDAMDAEHANLTGALQWALHTRPADGLAIANGLAPLWNQRGHWTEGRRLLGAALDAAASAPAIERARGLESAGDLALSQGDLDTARALLEEGLALAEETNDDDLVARIVSLLGGVAQLRGDLAGASVHFEAALNIARAIGSQRAIAGSLGNLGMLALVTGDIERAVALYTEATDVARANAEDSRQLAGVLGNAGMVFENAGENQRARAAYEEALRLAHEEGDVGRAARVQAHLGQLLFQENDVAAARAALDASRAVFHDLGDAGHEADALLTLGSIACIEARLDDALTLLQTSAALFGRIGHPIGQAVARMSLGEVDRRRGHLGPALDAFRSALEAFRAVDYDIGVTTALEFVAAVAHDAGEPARAAELLGAAAAIRTAMRAGEPSPVERPLTPETLDALERDERDAWARGAGLSLDAAVQLAIT
ncbi:MAG TPA: tetratricopeptide repeat protein [Acidimicrobiales bacterium]|nr:tetratricopeptide repeat protein [Acidimicrobiales bacterium]